MVWRPLRPARRGWTTPRSKIRTSRFVFPSGRALPINGEQKKQVRIRTEADSASFTFSGALSCSTGLMHACEGVMKSLRSVSVYLDCVSSGAHVVFEQSAPTRAPENAIDVGNSTRRDGAMGLSEIPGPEIKANLNALSLLMIAVGKESGTGRRPTNPK